MSIQKRLVVLFFIFLLATTLCLAIPFAATIALQETRALLVDRQADAEHFSQAAVYKLGTGQLSELSDEFSNYRALYGINVVLVNRGGEIQASSGKDVSLRDLNPQYVLRFLRGIRASAPDIVWPWTSGVFVVGVPVVVDDEVRGAIISISPVGEVRRDVVVYWGMLAGFAGAAVFAASQGLRPMSRWILRPVDELGKVVNEVARGNISARSTVQAGPTELRSFAKSFNAMVDTVERMVEERKELVSHVSHQIRTPLTVLRLQLENIRAQPGDVEAADVQLVIDEVDRLTWLCDGLLTLARGEALAGTAAQTDLSHLADERVSMWQTVATETNVQLIRTGEDAVQVRASWTALAQVFDVVIDNAVKFSPEGTYVVVHVTREDEWAAVHVIDMGPGLPPEARAQAVKPFWRGKGHEDLPGSGLGLTICATLAAKYDGEVNFFNAPTGGLDVRVRFPAVKEAEQ
ncbi:HAMP domain-containing sensor histidine kinase [Spongiactinospora sp. TRM90649]|nr:HAMP domain-containing sensor histidine kinase [Spongiactinospora sp. TRM90649]